MPYIIVYKYNKAFSSYSLIYEIYQFQVFENKYAKVHVFGRELSALIY
jgi:hypothetical protein